MKKRLSIIALIAGAVGAIICALGALFTPAKLLFIGLFLVIVSGVIRAFFILRNENDI